MSDHRKAIETVLKERRMSKVELAEAMGVSPQRITGLLSNDVRISSLNQAAAALNLKTSSLLRKGE